MPTFLLIMTYEDRRQWFLERVGKVVYRNRTTCSCSTCETVYKEGLMIGDRLQAEYLNDVVGESNIRYFDTLEERDEYEKSLK